jgi:hypothetical protein
MTRTDGNTDGACDQKCDLNAMEISAELTPIKMIQMRRRNTTTLGACWLYWEERRLPLQLTGPTLVLLRRKTMVKESGNSGRSDETSSPEVRRGSRGDISISKVS